MVYTLQERERERERDRDREREKESEGDIRRVDIILYSSINMIKEALMSRKGFGI